MIAVWEIHKSRIGYRWDVDGDDEEDKVRIAITGIDTGWALTLRAARRSVQRQLRVLSDPDKDRPLVEKGTQFIP